VPRYGVGYERHVVCTRRTTRSDRSADNVVAAFTKAKEADIVVLSSFGSTAGMSSLSRRIFRTVLGQVLRPFR
jgi:hypothetical protein